MQIFRASRSSVHAATRKRGVAKLLCLALGLALLAVQPANAFNSTDAAGINVNDGIGTSGNVDIRGTCGAPCKLSVSDDVTIPLGPAAGQPNWPFHWSSG
ncbi:MAG: hypothetical protein ABR548_08065, partial [Actinomycetota bacterium]